jgi:hypothetical protein
MPLAQSACATGRESGKTSHDSSNSTINTTSSDTVRSPFRFDQLNCGGRSRVPCISGGAIPNKGRELTGILILDSRIRFSIHPAAFLWPYDNAALSRHIGRQLRGQMLNAALTAMSIPRTRPVVCALETDLISVGGTNTTEALYCALLHGTSIAMPRVPSDAVCRSDQPGIRRVTPATGSGKLRRAVSLLISRGTGDGPSARPRRLFQSLTRSALRRR